LKQKTGLEYMTLDYYRQTVLFLMTEEININELYLNELRMVYEVQFFI